MKEAKFKALLFSKPYSNGDYPIFIRISLNRKSSYVSVGHSIPAGAWNPESSEVYESMPSLTSKMKESFSKDQIKDFKKKQASIILLPNASKINADIREKHVDLDRLQKKLSANEELISAEILKTKVENKDSSDIFKQDFIAYIEEVSKRKFDSSQIRTSEKYSVLKRKLKAFWKDKPLPTEKLTTSFLKEFQMYLHKEGSHQNYIHTNLKVLRTIIQKEAIREDKIILPEKNPFIWFEMPKVLPSKKEKLDITEIHKMEALKLVSTDYLFHVRNAFVFSLYNAGIRIGDLLQLKWCNVSPEGRLEYYMGKTGKERSIKLLSQALNILKQYEPRKEKETDYIFPFLDNNAQYSKLISPADFQKASPKLLELLFNKIESQISMYNAGLKQIALKAGIKKNISSHIARHSFADIARKKVSVYDIKNMLGHSSIKVTESYLKSLDNDSMDEAHGSVFN